MFGTKKKKKTKKKQQKVNLYYNNEYNVRKEGLKFKLEEWQENEINRCSCDPFYFIENYIKIRNVDNQELIPMKLRSYQHDMIQNILDERFVITMMSRQMGKTSTCSVLFLWYSLFKSNHKILVLANVQEKATEIIEEMQTMIKEIPLWLQKGVTEWNKKSITFENGSKIRATATTHRSGRGGTFNIVYIDEMAFIEENIIEKLMRSVFPSISSGTTTKMIITSTPQGRNYFWKLWTKSIRAYKSNNEALIKDAFKPLFYQWTEHPNRDESFKQSIITKFNLKVWRAEYECLFEGSNNTLVEGEVLETLQFNEPKEEKVIYREPFKLNIYEQPQENDKYILTVDPSEGLGLDYTAINVIKISQKNKLIQVATMYNNELTENPAPYVITEIAKYYNDALILYENNKIYKVAHDIIEKCEYDEIWCNPEDGRIGIRMSAAKRNRGLAQMQLELKKNRLILNDYDTIHELNVFVEKKGKFQAEPGEHDDLVTSLNLLMWFISDADRYKEYIEENINYINAIHDIDADEYNVPLIFYDNGIDKYRM